MFALKAFIEDDTENKTFMAYVADCLGTIAKCLGSNNLPLYSDMLEEKKSHKLQPQEVVEHVKKLFS